jgi:RHH-type proline utilization regulon transcriptional repressor/proline dehydrogenase/delta 1-pyrroline-5-carboxylate dehydrogenase
MASSFEDRVKKTGLHLYQLAAGDKPSLFKKDFWTGKIMDWSMKNEAFKQEMFRFVDVFPYLTRPESVAKHVQEYFCRPGQDFPKSMQWGLKLVKPDSMAAKMAAKSITKNINAMGKQFITGSDLNESARVMKKLRDQGVAWTVKILKEAVISKKDEADFLAQQLALIDELHELQRKWPALGGGPDDLDWGFTPKTNISLMASCLFSQYQTKACAFDYGVDMAKERLRPIYRKAMDVNAYAMLDMEHLPGREFTLAVANDTRYALTGGVFSRSPANIEKAYRDFQVGNLYINRAITGALVQRHPFGGFKMSGVGSKAMGPDYLPQFMFSRTIVENTFRSGFAPI